MQMTVGGQSNVQKRTTGTNNNTMLNSRQPNYQNTRNSITGFCERSVADYFNKIESGFLEKYMRYLIVDSFTPSYFQVSCKKFEPNPFFFEATHEFLLSTFVDALRAELRGVSNVSSNQIIMPCFGQDVIIKEGDLVYFSCSVKIPNSKLKRLPSNCVEAARRTAQQDHVTLQPNRQLHFVAFYNGDINFRFADFPSEYSEKIVGLNPFEPSEQVLQNSMKKQTSMMINSTTTTTTAATTTISQPSTSEQAQSTLSIFYFSKVAVFQHFVAKNNYKIDSIDDKIVTYYELNRTNQKQRQYNLLMAEKEKKRMQQTSIDVRGGKKSGTSGTHNKNNSNNQVNTYSTWRQLLMKARAFVRKRKILSFIFISGSSFAVLFVLKKALQSKQPSELQPIAAEMKL